MGDYPELSGRALTAVTSILREAEGDLTTHTDGRGEI